MPMAEKGKAVRVYSLTPFGKEISERTSRSLKVAAMWLYHSEYAESKLGIDKFWDSLLDSDKRTVFSMVRDIVLPLLGDDIKDIKK